MYQVANRFNPKRVRDHEDQSLCLFSAHEATATASLDAFFFFKIEDTTKKVQNLIELNHHRRELKASTSPTPSQHYCFIKAKANRMSVVQHILRPLAFLSLLSALALNAAVLSMCNFLQLQDQTIELHLGLFAYAPVNLSGQCIRYSIEVNDANVKAARAGSILALAFGAMVWFLLISRRFCKCKIRFEQSLVSLFFLLAQIFASLAWLVYHNKLCEIFGCYWGKAATVQLVCQIMYLVAAILSPYVPTKQECLDEAG